MKNAKFKAPGANLQLGLNVQRRVASEFEAWTSFWVLSLSLGVSLLIGCGKKQESASSSPGRGGDFPLPEKPGVANCNPGCAAGDWFSPPSPIRRRSIL